MKEFKVIEERGCGIEYEVFKGTYDECEGWIEDTLHDMYSDEELLDECSNGNGEPFTYRIE